MVRDLVEGVNVFGPGRWEDTKSAYNFPQSADTLKSYWYWLRREEHVSMIDKKWVLTSKLKKSCPNPRRKRKTSSADKGMVIE